ncbi:unnamed protein product, partial [Nesidiocoris tenuis]
MGITPKINFMPQLPWPPKPIMYEDVLTRKINIQGRNLWALENLVPSEHYSLSLTSYFLRLVNDTNHIIDEFEENIIYLPHKAINYEMVL